MRQVEAFPVISENGKHLLRSGKLTIELRDVLVRKHSLPEQYPFPLFYKVRKRSLPDGSALCRPFLQVSCDLTSAASWRPLVALLDSGEAVELSSLDELKYAHQELADVTRAEFEPT